MPWTDEVQPFGENHAPLLTGLSSSLDGTSVPVAVDPNTGAVLIESGIAPTGLFTKPYDEVAFSDPDANGNYQTITTLLASNPANDLTLTYDANNNVTDIKRVS